MESSCAPIGLNHEQRARLLVTRTLTLRDVGVELGGRAAIEGIDLVVTAGVPMGLTGPSGAGKTVLCLVLAGALAPTRGEVLLDDQTFEGGSETPIGLILQSHGLVAGLTAEENVALPLQARRVSRNDVARRSLQALASVGLMDHANRRVEELSGGEHQRVGIARALAADPVILVADEPTAELDPENRAIVLDLLIAHAANSNIVVVASDDPEVIAALPHVVELRRGQVEAVRRR
jgi:putative ABC transport system ATP-binding protein